MKIEQLGTIERIESDGTVKELGHVKSDSSPVGYGEELAKEIDEIVNKESVKFYYDIAPLDEINGQCIYPKFRIRWREIPKVT